MSIRRDWHKNDVGSYGMMDRLDDLVSTVESLRDDAQDVDDAVAAKVEEMSADAETLRERIAELEAENAELQAQLDGWEATQ